jgi:hypothetical protein
VGRRYQRSDPGLCKICGSEEYRKIQPCNTLAKWDGENLEEEENKVRYGLMQDIWFRVSSLVRSRQYE